jgi:RimJ/RimL family protein N-acetyltransferase
VRDASFVAANMRRQDFREISCLWEAWDTRALGICAVETAVPGMVWSAWYEGQPAAAFGFSRASAFDPAHWQAWAFGTDRFTRCVPAITRHILDLTASIARDCRRLQAITHEGHASAHRWIEALGAGREGRLRSYGRGGEDFYVYAWVRDGSSKG